MQRESDVKPTSRHWLEYVIGNSVGIMGFTGIFYVAIFFVLILFKILSGLFGPLDIASLKQMGDLVSDFVLWLSLFFAASLVVVHNVLNWESVSPYTKARLQHEYEDEEG